MKKEYENFLYDKKSNFSSNGMKPLKSTIKQIMLSNS